MPRKRPYQISIQTSRKLIDAFDEAFASQRFGSRSALFNAFMLDFIEGRITPRVRAALQRIHSPTQAEIEDELAKARTREIANQVGIKEKD